MNPEQRLQIQDLAGVLRRRQGIMAVVAASNGCAGTVGPKDYSQVIAAIIFETSSREIRNLNAKDPVNFLESVTYGVGIGVNTTPAFGTAPIFQHLILGTFRFCEIFKKNGSR